MNLHVASAACLVAAMIPWTTTSGQDSQPGSAHAAASAFGSWAAQEDYFDHKASDFRPSHFRTGPGALRGRWLAPGQDSTLLILPDPEGRKVEGDWFVMQAGPLEWSFESSYASFAVYGCDVDGDRLDEVVIEDGRGRGTFVYRRRLTMLKLLDGRWRSILREWLSSYLPDEEAVDLMWQRRYRFVRTRPGGFDVMLRLVPPARVPLSMDSSEDYGPLQHPVYLLRYCPEWKAFRIWDETFVRPGDSGGRQDLGNRPPVSVPVPATANGGR